MSLAIINGLTLFAGLAHAQPVDVRHSFNASLQPGGTLRQSPHPNVVVFTGVTPVPLETNSTPTGPVTNPVYSDKGLGGSNPIYSGLINQPTFDPFEDADFATIEVQLSSLGWSAREGIVHRDLAVRNVLLTTSRGRFSSLAGAQLILSSDGPTDVRSAGSDRPPIRWSAPEALRLYLNGDESTGAFFEASLSLDWAVVPAPGATALLGACAVFAARRRR